MELPKLAIAALGGTPGVGTLSGGVWHDADFDDQRDPGERLLEGWTVTLYRDNVILHSTLTDVDGNYRIAGVAPTYTAPERYVLRFSAPGAGVRHSRTVPLHSSHSPAEAPQL